MIIANGDDESGLQIMFYQKRALTNSVQGVSTLISIILIIVKSINQQFRFRRRHKGFVKTGFMNISTLNVGFIITINVACLVGIK